MDFLIAGLGLGALVTLAGLILRDRGASSQRRGSRSPAAAAADHQARAWGAGLTGGGLALIIVTAAAIMFAPSDAAGAAAVGAAIVACGLGAFAWSRLATRNPVPAAASAGAGRQPARARAVPTMPSRRPEAGATASRAQATRSTGRPRMAPEAPAAAARSFGAAPARDLPAPRIEEFDPAMDPAYADDRHDLPLPSPAGIPATGVDAGGRIGGNLSAPPAAARPERPSVEPDDRADAFAVIPLFRESDPADDLASAFKPIVGTGRSGDRPLPWEMAQAQEDEFIVDPALAAERLEDLPPPIPFSRNAPRD